MSLRFSTAVLRIAGAAAFICPAFGQTLVFDISAQDLRAALDTFIKTTNIQIVYRIDDVRDLKAHPVHGTMEVDAALALMLEGSGISVHRDPTGAVVIAKAVNREVSEKPQAVSSDDLETITVTGYRASLGKSLQQKRESVGVRDSILAEDIGKYPANNVAESLARVPGVVIARDTRTDEGKSVTVRGLDASYTIVTINGNPARVVTGTSVGSNNRSVDLDAFGADIFTQVDFYKSPIARLDEGGIGGVIDMRTARPFDYSEGKAAYQIGYSLNTYRNKAMPRGSIFFSHTTGSFGVLASFTFSEAAYQLMGSEVAGWGQSRNSVGTNIISTTFDFGPAKCGFDPRANIGYYSTDQVQQAYIPRFLSREHLELEDRTRYSGVVSLQYRPSEALDITLDFLAAKLIDKRSEYTLGPYMRSTATTPDGWAACQSGLTMQGSIGCSGIVPLNVSIDNHNNLYGTFANMGWIDENRWYDGDDRYRSAALNVRYAPDERMAVNFGTSVSDNRSFYSDNRIYFYALNTTVVYDPTANPKFPKLTTDTDLTDLSRWSPPSLDANYNEETDRVITGKLNAKYNFTSEVSLLANLVLEGGVSWVSSEKANDRKSNGAAVRATAMVNGVPFASLPPSAYLQRHLPVTNFLSGIAHDTRVMDWATVPRGFYQSLGMNAILARQDSIYSSVFDVTEAVESAYLQADSDGTLFGKALRLNVGLRYAATRLWGYNYASSKGSAGQTIYTKLPLKNKYDNLLPSFTIAYDAAEDVVLRAAYGETLTRPALGSIAQGTTILSRFNAAASSGNASLLPLQAQNIDLTAEWYFAADSLLSAGLYYKSLKNLISTQTETVSFSSLNLPWSSLDQGVFGATENPNLAMQLSHPVNLNPMMVRGFEVFYQQPFSFLPEPLSGLGSLVSFTYTAGAAGGPGTGFVTNDGAVYKKQITGLSSYTLTGTAYYERGPYTLRATYSWHSASPAEDVNHNSTDLRLWNQARGNLDVTLGYALDKTLELRLDATNLLNAEEYSYVTDGTQGHSRLAVGRDTGRINLDYLHGSTFLLSLRGQL